METAPQTDKSNPTKRLTLADKLTLYQKKFNNYEYPRVSIIIPTYNCAQVIGLTLESILPQHYPNFEIIVVDARSTDRTLEIVKGYRDEKIRVFSVSAPKRYEMLNKGITHATGGYINFLFPGDFYIYNDTIKYMMTLALEHDKPYIVYCGTLLRNGKSEVKILYRQLNLQLLQHGQQPTSLQSCWFRTDIFSQIGKFNTTYRLRGGYELLCRLTMNPKFQAVSTQRVLTDYDLRLVTRRMVLRHFWETLRTIYRYFGLIAALKWLATQKDTARFIKLWLRNVRVAFLGR